MASEPRRRAAVMAALLVVAAWSAAAAPVAPNAPVIESMRPLSGSDAIDVDQRFWITLTTAVAEPALPADAWCEVPSRAERLPLVVVDGAERDAALKERGLRNPEVIARTLLVRCARALPPHTVLRVVWGAQRFRYKTRGAFTAGYRDGESNSRSIATSMTMWQRL